MSTENPILKHHTFLIIQEDRDYTFGEQLDFQL